ncbi:hypothetical protein NOR51B_221 [Luminiphilus syltensis NOR5-1B]|uniref:Uncharacterized protein n=1 Tax=Luminiphilus syltensis NOR5-1B TaxID=565045 RepID=B8KXT8_9GAMM|nr:hypothetical protein NOR51B_221 [Luminiphilus syltensis NOR5-1B]
MLENTTRNPGQEYDLNKVRETVEAGAGYVSQRNAHEQHSATQNVVTYLIEQLKFHESQRSSEP